MNARFWVGFLAVALACFSVGCSKDVKIGAIISESGSLAPYGKQVRKGLDLALEEINAEGGINGGTVQLIYRDDATNEGLGTQVAEELINQEGVRVIIGAVGSPVTLAIAPICEENRVLLMSPSSSAPKISEAGDYIYRNYPSDIVEGTAMAKFARDLGLEKVAIFAVNTEFGAGLRDVFSQQYEGRYREIVKTFEFEDGAVDEFPAMIEELQQLKPDGIYVASYVDDLAALLGFLREARIDAVVMGTSAVTRQILSVAGEAAENFVYPQTDFDVQSHEPSVVGFVQAFRAKYNEDPEIFAAHGYDALKILAHAASPELGGSAHPNDLKLGLRSIESYEGAAGRTVFDANGDVVRYPRIFIVRDGEAKPYEEYVEEGGSLLAGG